MIHYIDEHTDKLKYMYIKHYHMGYGCVQFLMDLFQENTHNIMSLQPNVTVPVRVNRHHWNPMPNCTTMTCVPYFRGD